MSELLERVRAKLQEEAARARAVGDEVRAKILDEQAAAMTEADLETVLPSSIEEAGTRVPVGSAGPFCTDCGYALDAHTFRGLRVGCPDENAVRELYGK